MTTARETLERSTGELFSELWPAYDRKLFEESVELFTRRLELAGFDRAWFRGKACLDAGCGGGRNTIAMARLGAREAIGIDLGTEGLADARARAADLPNARFEHGSILEIPFEDERFDLTWCAGVLMITADPDRALDELARVTRSGGVLYLLVYATGGLRWPLIRLLRPLAAHFGQPAVERAITRAGLAANKRRTFLDDLFCPKLDFFPWERLERMLERRGFASIERWGPECRLDHEQDLASYRKDLEALEALFAAGERADDEALRPLFHAGQRMIAATLDAIRHFERAVESGELGEDEAMARAIGQGHHRVLARKA